MLLIVLHFLFVVCFEKFFAQCTSPNYSTCSSNSSCIFVDGTCYTNNCSSRTCAFSCFNSEGVCRFDECVLFSDSTSCDESGYGCSIQNPNCRTVGQTFVLVASNGSDSYMCGHSSPCKTVEYALNSGGGSSVFMRKKLYFGEGIFQFRPKNYTYTQSGFGDNFNAFIGNAPVSSSNATILLMQINGSLQYSYSYFFNFDNVQQVSLYFVNLILSFEMLGTTVSSFNGTFIRLGAIGSKVIIDSCILQQSNSEKLSMTLFQINNGSILIIRSTIRDFSFVSTYYSAVFASSNALGNIDIRATNFTNITGETQSPLWYCKGFRNMSVLFKDVIIKNIQFNSSDESLIWFGSNTQNLQANISITGSVFENIISKGRVNGSVLFIANSITTLIYNTSFKNISGEGVGGAVYITYYNFTRSVTIVVNSSSFINCQTSSSIGGGAIGVDESTTINFTNSTFTSCSSMSGKGGAVFIGSSGGVYYFSRITFTLCRASSYYSNDIYLSYESSYGAWSNYFNNVCTDVRENGFNHAVGNLDGLFSTTGCNTLINCSQITVEDFCVSRVQCNYDQLNEVCVEDGCFNNKLSECNWHTSCVKNNSKCITYFDGFCESLQISECVPTEKCYLKNDKCILNPCYTFILTECENNESCVMNDGGDNCIPYEDSYCPTRTNIRCTHPRCVLSSDLCELNKCYTTKEDVAKCNVTNSTCVVSTQDRCVPYDSGYCSSLTVKRCTDSHCVVLNNQCVDNVCFIYNSHIQDCESNESCVINSNGVCVPYYSTYCALNRIDNCTNPHCLIRNNLCVENACYSPSTDASACEANNSCAFDTNVHRCVPYDSSYCPSQTVEGCINVHCLVLNDQCIVNPCYVSNVSNCENNESCVINSNSRWCVPYYPSYCPSHEVSTCTHPRCVVKGTQCIENTCYTSKVGLNQCEMNESCVVSHITKRCVPYYDEYCSNANVLSCTNPHCLVEKNTCTINLCYLPLDNSETCERNESCVISPNTSRCVPYYEGYCHVYDSLRCTNPHCAITDDMCVESWCYNYTKNQCASSEICVHDGVHCVPYYSLFCKTLAPTTCDLKFCVNNSGICEENWCRSYNVTSCNSNYECVVFTNSCVPYFTGYCEQNNLHGCNKDYCVEINSVCTENPCRYYMRDVDACKGQVDCVYFNKMCYPYFTGYCEQTPINDCTNPHCSEIGGQCMYNDCFDLGVEGCSSFSSCVVYNGYCVPYFMGYCQFFNASTCDLNYCVMMDDTCVENVCRVEDMSLCTLMGSCVEYEGRCVPYFSDYCELLDPKNCTNVYCTLSDSKCIDNVCRKYSDLDECDAQEHCVVYNGACRTIFPGFCSENEGCASSHCTIIEGTCKRNSCPTQHPSHGVCAYPCIADNGRCVVSPCAYYTADECILQQDSVCKLTNGSSDLQCVPDTNANACQFNYKWNEVECEGDKWCFWNEELLSVLKCDEVEIKKLCEDALTEKECYIAEEGQYDACRCEFTDGQCVYIDETNLSESRSTVLRGILLTIFIPIGFVILSIITMIIIVLIRSARKEKLANIERLKHMSVNSKFMDDDGEVDAFFNNHQDFVV